MFAVTAFGHHSFLIESAGARLFVDPILTARWGFTDAVGLCVYPPRSIDVAAIGPISAVYLTHEHEGHFEPATLCQIDRRVPILISSRSSHALETVLREMGFQVRAVEPGRPVRVGALTLLPMTGDRMTTEGDEWDVLPYLVWDQGGHGSFFTYVDSAPTPEMWQLAREKLARPGIFAFTHNANDWGFEIAHRSASHRDLQTAAIAMARYTQAISAGWARPAALLFAGQGYGFTDDRAWLDTCCVPWDIRELAEVVAALVPRVPVRAAEPGQTWHMVDGALVEIEASAPFIRAQPREVWPARGVGALAWLEEYPPATGRAEASDEEIVALQAELALFAGYLHGGLQARLINGLSSADLEGRRATVAIVARSGEAAYVFAYEPQACTFSPAACEDPAAEFMGVFECWATDLLAVLRAEVSANTLLFGRSRIWCARPEVFGVSLASDLLVYCHPLRHPERFLALYRRVLAEQPPPPTLVAWNEEVPCFE